MNSREIQNLIDYVAEAFGSDPEKIRTIGLRYQNADARHAAVYILYQVKLSETEIAGHMRLNPESVSKMTYYAKEKLQTRPDFKSQTCGIMKKYGISQKKREPVKRLKPKFFITDCLHPYYHDMVQS
ncbi:MAG: hypothetical protein ACLFQX_04060 [Candidatus Kapaibacterium sp.]